MDFSHCRILIHELLNKHPDIVPEEAPLIILDSNYYVCMDNNVRDNNHTRHISRRVVGENGLNTRMKYIIVRLNN